MILARKTDKTNKNRSGSLRYSKGKGLLEEERISFPSKYGKPEQKKVHILDGLAVVVDSLVMDKLVLWASLQFEY